MQAIDWLTKDWRLLVPWPYAESSLALIAVLCGALVGEERERREKPAGLRTLMLVCLGAAAFTMASFVFTSTTGDSGRVAAQIVTGFGFLGAGVIMHSRGTVSGATTAAIIWVMASIGMIAGMGQAGAAVGLSVLVRFVLAGIAAYENFILKGREERRVILEFNPDGGRTRVRLERILADFRPTSVAGEWQDTNEGLCQVTLHLRLQRRALCELLDDLVDVQGIKNFREVTSVPARGFHRETHPESPP